MCACVRACIDAYESAHMYQCCSCVFIFNVYACIFVSAVPYVQYVFPGMHNEITAGGVTLPYVHIKRKNECGHNLNLLETTEPEHD